MSFWFDDPSVLFSKTSWAEFMPTPVMSVPRALNATVRFTVYFSLLLFLATRRIVYIFLIPVVMISTVFANTLFPRVKEMTIEGFRSGGLVSGYRGEEEVEPTRDNPFMNPTLVEIQERPNKPPAADITRKDIRDSVNKQFVKTTDVLMDHGDPFQVVQSQINFHSVVRDDHGGFLTFLKGNGTSDKALSDGYVATKGTFDLSHPAA